MVDLLFVVVVEFGLHCEPVWLLKPAIPYTISRWNPVRSYIRLFPLLLMA